MLIRPLLCSFIVLFGLRPSAGAQAAEHPAIVVAPVMFTAPGPAVVADAQKAGWALEGVAGRRDGDARPGDAVLALACFFNGEKQQQWLVRFTVAELNDEERKAPAGEETVSHTSTGRALKFGVRRVALATETIGPFAMTGAAKNEPPIKRARIVVNEEFLALGIHRVGEIFDVFRAFESGVGKGEAYNYSFGGTPFPAETVTAGKKLAERMGLTEDAERSFVGSFPALIEFFQIAKDTPGVSDLLFAVLDKPSVWSMAKGLATRQMGAGFDLNQNGMGAIESSPWQLGVAQSRVMPMQIKLFGKPALDVTLYAGEPRPPLRTTAGVFGLLAKSIKAPSRFLVIRVLSAQAGAGAATATPKAP